jgi:predicted nucleic acid-binding protein
MNGAARAEAPAVVLDTNAVLDWLLFADARCAPLRQALEARQLRWLSCARMREEFSRTLAYPTLSNWNPDSERLLTLFDHWASPQPEPVPAPLPLRCDDPDDQVFIDLALATGARWLISHDRALLRLRRRAATRGLLILRPGDWAPPART